MNSEPELPGIVTWNLRPFSNDATFLANTKTKQETLLASGNF
jgi:hypothetical protein